MRFSTQIKSISYVKSHAAELLDRITEEREPIIITQNGEARAVLIDIESYEQHQETVGSVEDPRFGRKGNRGRQDRFPRRGQGSVPGPRSLMARFTVWFTTGAVADLRAIHGYIAQHDSPGRADYAAGQILRVVSTLERFPQRGVYPPELLQVEIRAYRQIFFKPYRIIYRISEHTVFVMIADGRRDLAALLMRRLHEG